MDSAREATGVRSGPRRFAVVGLCCASEARQIEAKLKPRRGVLWVRVDPVRHTLTVGGDIPAGEVEGAIAELGMKARRMDTVAVPPSWWARHGRPVLAATSGVLTAATMVARQRPGSPEFAAALAVAAVVAGGWYVLPRGFRAAMNRALDMNFLMSVAAIGALLIGEYAEAASVMFLFAVAQLLETYSMDRARNAIRSLMELAPVQASVLREGREVRIAPELVVVGEIVVVRAGEKIAVDGIVVSGRSSVNEAAITGESAPAEKEPETSVYAGTINGAGALEVRSTKPASDTTLARIIHSIDEAQAARAPSQTFVERVARIYTPIVVAAAMAVATIPPALGNGAWSEWLYRALALLVVACPCALVISTPVTVVSALAGGARLGILIKGGRFLEAAGRARVFALDKTGTLTEGRPEVVSIVPLKGATASHILAVAAAAEARSEHPLAAAILRRAGEAGTATGVTSGSRAIAGRGAEARLDGRRVLVGNQRLFAENSMEDAAAFASARELEAAGNSVMLVAESNGFRPEDEHSLRIIGVIALSDRPRPEAAAALEALHEAGIKRIVMLTGDNQGTAESVANALRGTLNQVRSGLLPQDKVAAVRELKAQYGSVLMVGDGINDAPALAAADVGIALGAAGTDVALETADIALMTDDLTKLAVLVRLARKSERIIRENIAFAVAVKALFVVLAAAGAATLWMAVLADMGASLLVIGNGLRALRVPAAPAGSAPAAAMPSTV